MLWLVVQLVELKSTYRRRLLKEDKCKIEAPWVTEEIRLEIKKRQKLNRAKRNCSDAEDKKRGKNVAIHQTEKESASYNKRRDA